MIQLPKPEWTAQARVSGRGWRRWAGTAVAVGGWLCLAAAVGAWGLLQAADLWWPATLLMFSPRWLLAVPPALLLPLAGWLRRWALVPLLLAVAVILGPVMGLCVPWQRLVASDPPAGLRLRLLTCNMHYQAKDPGPIDRLLAEVEPDVVTLQEWPHPERSVVLAKSGWHVLKNSQHVVASRYPIRLIDQVGKDSMKEEGSVGCYELETPAGTVTVFSVHLASPRKALQQIPHISRSLPADLQAESDLRREQCEHLASKVGDVPGPLLLAGDFNTPPESAIFRQFWAGYTDAFAAAGWGWGHTFIIRRTTVRIDHILASPGWRCTSCWVGPDVGSPHRPVIADLTWEAGAERR